ncbi:vacuolar ATPase assembly integral membrane protein vma21 [Geranomyces variabilis]|nr:vacuolar ATPase assembly integral membrane protein vma21 [Geranomyces variabilis]
MPDPPATLRQRPTAAAAATADSPASPSVASSLPLPPLAARPQVPFHVLAKLILFSILLFALPIATYFASLDRLFSGNQNYSAIAAVVVANCVVFAYVLVAILEDQGGDDEGTKITASGVRAKVVPEDVRGGRAKAS